MFLSLCLQPASVMDTRENADLTWNCTGYQEGILVEFVSDVGIILRDDTAIIARKVIIETLLNLLRTVKRVEVSYFFRI